MHLSDYGSEQNVILPPHVTRLYCDLHDFFNVHSHITNVDEGYFEVNGQRFNAAASFEILEYRFPVETAELRSTFHITKE